MQVAPLKVLDLNIGKALATKLGINQNLSTAFHPQTDGLSERKN